MHNRVFLSLGSNINPSKNLRSAVKLLNLIGKITAASSVWETAPVGFSDQDNFLNAVVLLETEREFVQLVDDDIPGIEKELGRVRGKKKDGPRSIDIDILSFNDQVIDYGRRHLPNPEIVERPFVGIPLAEIAPDEIHPELGVSYGQIAAKFKISNNEMVVLEDFQLIAEQNL